jgi:O-antigen ligase
MDFEPNAYNEVPQEVEENKGSRTMAIVSMILGIIALVSCVCYCSAIPLGIVGIILAIIVLAKKKNGKPFAITGLVTSILGVVCSAVVLILYMPMVDNLEEFMNNVDEYVEDYQEDGTIPDTILEMFGGNEDLAKNFMDGFSSSYQTDDE